MNKIITGHEADMQGIAEHERTYDVEAEFRATLALCEQRISEFKAGTYEDDPDLVALFGPATLESLEAERDQAAKRLAALAR